jgi:hypothetical protein
MDYFYDGQIRRYVTQFMRIFIGFQYKTGDGELKHVPVMYGDMTRQVASIIKENSENKLPTVPRIACYITGLELDRSRLSDPTFVSKMNIRERNWESVDGEIVYDNSQGGGYTIERLMPTPYNLTMKADIWTSNVDQKLQLLEQIAILFTPSLDIQTTDNYIDWTSLSVVDLQNVIFSSRTIPQGVDSEIEITTMEFKMPMYITPPAKVKKLGVIRNVIMNVFTETGSVLGLEDLVFNQDPGTIQLRETEGNFSVLLLKSNNGQTTDYDLSVLDPKTVIRSLSFARPIPLDDNLDWNLILELYGRYFPGISLIYFLQPDGTEIRGTFVVNEIDPSKLLVSIQDIPSNTVIISTAFPQGKTTVDAVIDPYKFNPELSFGGIGNITVGTRYLILDNVNDSENVGGNITREPVYPYDGPDGWKNLDGSDPVIPANAIIEWTGSEWENLLPNWKVSTAPFDNTIVYLEGQIVKVGSIVYKAVGNITRAENIVTPDLNSKFQEIALYFTNLRTGIQYRWGSDGQWYRSFEGEYTSGYWRFDLDPL